MALQATLSICSDKKQGGLFRHPLSQKEKTMKKLLSVLLSLTLVFLCSCGKTDSNITTKNSTTAEIPGTSLTEAPDITELSPQINLSTVIEDENFSYPINIKKSVILGAKGGSSLSGLAPLEKISYTDSKSGKNLSNEKMSHSHGPASDGQPHHTVVDFQKTFDRFGAYTLDTKSNKKVLYLTFDCGYEYNNLTASILDTLKEKQVPAAFFCTLDHIKKETDLISRMINEGHIVGNHSSTHPSFAEISREKMAKEIEETENYLRTNYGYASKFFRFPAGEYTESALDLVASLGYISVFWSVAYNDWNTDNIQGKDYAVNTVMSRLHDGAIILLHSVSQDNSEALGEIIDKARAEGYEFRALTELGS